MNRFVDDVHFSMEQIFDASHRSIAQDLVDKRSASGFQVQQQLHEVDVHIQSTLPRVAHELLVPPSNL